MITAHTIDALKRFLGKAFEKAEKVNPALEIIEFGHYKVESSKGGDWYEVRAGRTEDQKLFIACKCRGGLEGRPCYHAAKVFLLHTSWATIVKTPVAAESKMASDPNDIPYLKGADTKPSERIGGIRV